MRHLDRSQSGIVRLHAPAPSPDPPPLSTGMVGILAHCCNHSHGRRHLRRILTCDCLPSIAVSIAIEAACPFTLALGEPHRAPPDPQQPQHPGTAPPRRRRRLVPLPPPLPSRPAALARCGAGAGVTIQPEPAVLRHLLRACDTNADNSVDYFEVRVSRSLQTRCRVFTQGPCPAFRARIPYRTAPQRTRAHASPGVAAADAA
jgi:hypothetical protein